MIKENIFEENKETQSSLFLAQSYQDAWADYSRALKKERFARWDYVVLTASNEEQAEGFREQIQLRHVEGLLPIQTKVLILPDPEGKRVGSGGATLNVLRAIAEEEKSGDFSGKKILVIHSGGDSKRVPQYSALGKLFSPVPHKLPDGRTATLFDEFMAEMSGVAGRIREGMVLLSGDVLLLFNSLQIDFPGRGAAAVSFKENVETGKNHGVFLMGDDGNVKEFLHKQTTETLRQQGAVNQHDAVDIDTGMVIFSTEMLHSLYRMISNSGAFDETKYKMYVNDKVRLSLYGDFLYPLASDSTLEAFYNEKPEGEYCQELTEARKVVWELLRPYRMKLLRLSPAKFLHFGTTREILKLMTEDYKKYELLGWDNQVNSSLKSSERIASLDSVCSVNAECGDDCYLEVSYVHPGSKIGNNVVLSYIDVHGETIPDDIVLHGLKQRDDQFVVRIYGINDNPKTAITENGCAFLTGTLKEFMEKNNIKEAEIWDSEDSKTLWTAKLYPVCASISEAVGAALNIYALVKGEGNVETWRSSRRTSLCSGFVQASPRALIDWQIRMHELVIMDSLEKVIRDGGTLKDAEGLFQDKIIFDSRDMDTHGEFTEIHELQNCSDPYDPFALQKAALLVCGIIPVQGYELKDILHRLGGGIFMSTEVVNVPKGSGLGTSSILAGACVKALFEFVGISYTQEDLYDHVLCMEQLMSTGGGWQDQVGGLSTGAKYITAGSGMHQYPKVKELELSEKTKNELNERFALIYTGQRRLARNLLRDVVGRYMGNEPDALYALSEIQKVATLMRFELERGNVDGFAELLTKHWELSKKLDSGSTNTCIDQIFAVIEDLTDGQMICGAGGGGFLQVILKKGITKEQLHNRLNHVFQDSGVDVWESEILW